MSAQAGIPVIVVTRREDDVESVSRCLRNAGQPAHCQWVAENRSLPEVLAAGRAQLLCVYLDDDFTRLAEAATLRDRHAPGLPLIGLYSVTDEATITQALNDGAQDLVTPGAAQRLSAVAIRELGVYRNLRALRTAQDENQAFKTQLAELIDESSAAIVYASEGIISNVNPAWLELFGYADADDLFGLPILDLFTAASRAAIKGALIACVEGKWSDHPIMVKVHTSDGGTLKVRANLQQSLHDGEPCVRISMEPERYQVEEHSDSADRHPVSGLFLRKRFVAELEKHLSGSPAPGVTLLAYIKPDEMGETRDVLDPVASDQLVLDLAQILTEAVKPNDLYGQFGGDIFMVLLSRGTLRDARAWADDLRRTVASHVFEAGNKSVSLTCTVGLAQLDPHNDDLNSFLSKAQIAFRNGRESGGDQVVMLEKDGSMDRGASAVSPEMVKQALMQDGFILVYQPVASMLGKSREMFDVLLRMKGNDGNEIMPADFLPTARQCGLMKNIDRWVIANAVAFCARHTATQLFVRLSEESIPDKTLVPWFSKQITDGRINPSQIVMQVTEQHAEEHLKEIKALVLQFQKLGCSFAIEHFGVGHRPLQVLEHVPVNIIKVDGSLMAGLQRNPEIQQKVRLYIETAKARNIETIAERVEDANTMAVLWQLGVEFIQGYYVQGPEEIVLESAEA